MPTRCLKHDAAPAAVNVTGAQPISFDSRWIHARAERSGDELTPQAEAEQRTARRDALLEPLELAIDERVLVVLVDADRPAEHDEKIGREDVDGVELGRRHVDVGNGVAALCEQGREQPQIFERNVAESERGRHRCAPRSEPRIVIPQRREGEAPASTRQFTRAAKARRMSRRLEKGIAMRALLLVSFVLLLARSAARPRPGTRPRRRRRTSFRPRRRPHIRRAIESPERTAEQRARDYHRKPAEILTLSGIEEGDKIVEIAAFGQYFTTMLLAAVGPSGHVDMYDLPYTERFAGPASREFDAKHANAVYHQESYNDVTLPQQRRLRLERSLLPRPAAAAASIRRRSTARSSTR